MEIKSFDITDLNEIDIHLDLHELAMKYRNMNIFQRLIFRIKAKIYKPKLDWDKISLYDTTTILENLPRENKSYKESIKECYNGNFKK